MNSASNRCLCKSSSTTYLFITILLGLNPFFTGDAHSGRNNAKGASMISLSRFYTIFLVLAALLAAENVQAYTFDWGAVTWSPNGSLHHVYNSVDGSTVDVDINVTGNTNRFIYSTPRIRSLGLQSYPNFANHNERVIFTYTFSQPVIIRDFSILDIDGRAGSWGDAVIVTARSETGATLDPDHVVAGSFLNQVNPHQYEATNHQTSTTDSRSTLTFSFRDEPITELTITHYPAAIAASNPGGSAVIMTDFDFFYVYDYGDAGGYGTARHIRHFNEPWLGTSRGDADLTAPQTNGNADADDTDGTDDEDGVTFRSPHGGDHAEIYADMQVVNDTGGDVYACAWLDRWDGTGNGGGSFDAGDVADSPAQACQTVADNGGVATTTTFYWNGLPSVSGHTFSRFRVCATLAECQNPTGDANGGEVEDHRIDFDFNPTLAVIENFRVELMDARTAADTAGLLKLTSTSPIAVIRWDTAQEHGTVGFHVERKSPGSSDWHQINKSMLPGLITAPQGGEYLLPDHGAAPGVTYLYRLIEEEIWGTRKIYGPWQISPGEQLQTAENDSASPRRLQQNTQYPWRNLANNFVGRAKPVPVTKKPARKSLPSRQLIGGYTIQGAPTHGFSLHRRRINRVRFRTREEGMYRIKLDDLAAVTNISSQRIADKLFNGQWSFSSGGNPASYYFDVDRQEFLFAADTWRTTETRDNIYRLGKFRKRQGWNMDLVTGQGPESGQPDQFRETLFFTEDNLLLTWVHKDENADYGYWDYSLAPGNHAATDLTLRLPDPASASASQGRLKIVLRGAGDQAPGNDHLVRVYLNDELLDGEIAWDGNSQATLETSFSQQLLGGSEAGETVTAKVTVEGEALNGALYSLVYIESVEVSYDRKMYALNDELLLHETTDGITTVSGFSGPDIRVMENPHTADALLREDITITESGDGFQVSFESSGGEYLLSSAPRAILAEPDLPSRLLSRRNRADYLVITPDALLQSAQELADYRQNRFTTSLVRLQDIYDVFSHGRVDSYAIKRFLEYIYKRWQQVPEYVTLMGRGTLDHADLRNSGESQIPLRMAATPWGLIGSDNRYADIDGDHVPEFAIGRIAVSTNTQGKAYVNKLKSYELETAGPWSRHAVVIADDPDQNAGDFYTNSDETSQVLEDLSYSVDKLYHPASNIHDTLLDGWNQGQFGLVNYNGHGGRTQLGTGTENFLRTIDVDSLHNADHLPVFTALTCATGDSSYPGILSLGDTLTLHEGGGAIASFVPTGLSLDGTAHQLNLAWIQALINDDQTIGEAAVQALGVLRDNGSQDYMLDLYSTSGDPAVQVPR